MKDWTGNKKSAFTTIGAAGWYLKNGKGTPTFSDAIEWARKQTIDEVCEWMMNFKNAAGQFPLYDYVGNFRKTMEDLYGKRTIKYI